LREAMDRVQRVAHIVRCHREKLVFLFIGGAELLDELVLLRNKHLVLQLRPDAGPNFGDVKRLWQIIYTAFGPKNLDYVIRRISCGDEKNRGAFRARILLQALVGLDAAYAGHDHIKEQQVGLKFTVNLEGLLSTAGIGQHIAIISECRREYRDTHAVIIDDKNFPPFDVDC